MKIHTLEPLLKENPFFEGMDERQLSELVGCATNLRFDAGQRIFREGEKADRFYIIRQGAVDLELTTDDGEELKLETLSVGDILGWSWLFPPYLWRFSAHCTELTRVISMDGDCIKEKCQADHELGHELMKRFALIVVDRLQHTRVELLHSQGHRKKA